MTTEIENLKKELADLMRKYEVEFCVGINRENDDTYFVDFWIEKNGKLLDGWDSMRNCDEMRLKPNDISTR